MNLIMKIAAGTLAFAAVACSAQKQKSADVAAPESTVIADGPTVSPLPRAQVYKMSGDYADLVPITLDPSGTRVMSYPAPTDVKNQEPVKLDDGWYLDRRGVGTNTAFTSYTYKEYAALKHAPSTEDLLKHIVPEAKVTEIMTTPFAIGEGTPEQFNAFIKASKK